MDSSTPVVDNNNVSQDIVNWVNRKKATNRMSSNKYYERNYIIKDDMTDEQKQTVTDNINKRKMYYQQKYEQNKDLIKNRVKQYRQQMKQSQAPEQ